MTKTKTIKADTNGITSGIRGYLQHLGYESWRINVMGIFDEEHNRWRRSGSTKGVFDVHTIINGRAIWIDTKKGKDKPSPEQLLFKEDVEKQGGIAIFAKTYEEFVLWLDNYLKDE